MVKATEHKIKVLETILVAALREDYTSVLAVSELCEIALAAFRKADILERRLDQIVIGINNVILESYGIGMADPAPMMQKVEKAYARLAEKPLDKSDRLVVFKGGKE
jgi:hypothetical protein